MTITPIYDYRISTGASAAHGTGVLNVSAGSTALGGVGTSFTTQLHVGDIIISGGMTLCVATITDNTNLVLVTAASVALSSASFDYDPMVNVETLGDRPSPPKGDFFPWVEYKNLGNGLARGVGRPRANWLWSYGPNDFISHALRDALRGYCPAPAKSARVFIRTKTNDSSDVFKTYQAAMLWTDQETRVAGRRLSFVIEMRDLVLL